MLRGRLAGVSVRASMAAGGWIGFALGLVLGAALGGLLSWFAGSALQWQRDLGLTLGVAENLLPLGDQITMLRTLADYWYLVIPATALVSGLVWAVFAALVAGLVAAGYNRASRHTVVLVELPESEVTAVSAELASIGEAEPGEWRSGEERRSGAEWRSGEERRSGAERRSRQEQRADAGGTDGAQAEATAGAPGADAGQDPAHARARAS